MKIEPSILSVGVAVATERLLFTPQCFQPTVDQMSTVMFENEEIITGMPI